MTLSVYPIGSKVNFLPDVDLIATNKCDKIVSKIHMHRISRSNYNEAI